MTERFGPVADVLHAQVDSGRLPGFVAAIRAGGRTEVLAGGRLALDGDARTEPDTLFRLASVTKPFAGALTLGLVADGVLGLDDEIGTWLPELAEPRVTARRGGPLDETVPAERPITVRHLLANTAGMGWSADIGPLADAMEERDVGPGAFGTDLEPDEYLARLAGLPLSGQPGETWNYHTCSDVLTVLLARATGRRVGELLDEKVTGPLGLTGTAFWTAETGRLASCYLPTDGGLELVEPPDGRFAAPRSFESLSAGLVATAPDVLRFFCAVVDGCLPGTAPMTHDQLTPGQLAAARDFLGPGRSWGFQVAVDTEPVASWRTPGRWGWDGGTGTSAWADPARDVVGVLLTQRMMTGPHDEPDAFWSTVYGCL